MTNAVTDNSISTQNVVLWQYDKATKFCAVVDLIETWGKKATEAFWKYWVERVHGLFTITGTQQELAAKIDDFSLALWGIFAGVARPTLTVGGTTAPMSKILYRKVLAARLKLLQTNGSLRDISQYCADIFGANKVIVSEGIEAKIGSTVSAETASVTVSSQTSSIASASVVALQYGKILGTSATFTYSTADGGWHIGTDTEIIPSNRLSEYGMSFVLAPTKTSPGNGDSLTVTYSVTGITNVVVNSATCLTGLAGGTSQTLTYSGGSWSPSLATYGVTVRGTAQSGDTITLTYNQAMGLEYSSPVGALTGEEAALFDKGDYWKFYPAGVLDNAPPVTRFVAFKGQYQAELTAKGTVAQTTTKPNFFSGTDDNNIDWKGVFHPKTRSWAFYDEAMEPVEGTYAMAYANGTWTLSSGGSTATQTGRATSVWCDYGVYFVKGSGTGGTFPSVGIVAKWV